MHLNHVFYCFGGWPFIVTQIIFRVVPSCSLFLLIIGLSWGMENELMKVMIRGWLAL
jgi:hypothetical protein